MKAKKNILFTIITPSYNQGGFIEKTIQSVLQQEIDLEYWVMDGGSQDNTLSILKKYKKKHSNFNFISKEDKGQTDAINQGMKMAKGDIIAYLNSDDEYVLGALKKVQDAIENNSDYKWFYGKSIIINQKNQTVRPFFTKLKNFLAKRYSFFKLLSFNIISQPATFITREAIEKVGCFNLNDPYTFDYEYWVRLGQHFKGCFINENIAKFRVHPEAKTAKGNITMYKTELEIAWKYIAQNFNLFKTPHYLLAAIIHFFHFFLIITWNAIFFKWGGKAHD